MKQNLYNHISDIVSVFQGRFLPEQDVLLAGYAALIKAFDLSIPLPDKLAAISHKHTRYEKNDWLMLTPRHTPELTLFGHLKFALKYEGLNLSVLKAFYAKVDSREIIKIVNSQQTGSYARRIWFLYEWLLDKRLELSDATRGNFIDVLDSKLQYAGPSRASKRHRVKNNLPGVRAFCPLIRKTQYLETLIAENLSALAKKNIGKIHPDILRRAAAFLLLKDSKASFAIENEIPNQTRSERWAQIIAQAGTVTLSHEELLRLQEALIADFRFTHFGYRNAGGFVGNHERVTGLPVPEHISARWQDVPELMDGIIATETLLKNSHYEPVLLATIIAFGFVFIHPFEDGNGRIHRYLIHHELLQKDFSPKGFVFPVSAILLEKIEQYRQVLQAFSKPRLPLVSWRPTLKGNIEVTNETIDLYRYFDATIQTEFLYSCIKETIEKSLPAEVNYLKKYDELKQFINNYLEMPDTLLDLMIRFLNQNGGKFSKRALNKEFAALTNEEVVILEAQYANIFGNAVH
jgi:Fic family protein